MSEPELPRIVPLGDRALVAHLGKEISRKTFDSIRSLSHQLSDNPPKGFVELVPAFTTLTVYYDPLVTTVSELTEQIRRQQSVEIEAPEANPRIVEVPVCYGGEFGEDLELVAKHAGFSAAETIRIHASSDYIVHMIGFAPGFPYLGGMSPKIAAPRRSSPRLKVPVGSVGIAGEQTGIYPLETPGGWQIIGRTPLALFRPNEDPPTLLQAGDIVRFRSISQEEFREMQKERA
jgi:inhibitor of KinA